METKRVAVSGGFDPVHIGHVRMFEEARKLGDELVVILNNDNWLTDKKGFAFMPEKERAELILAYPFVDHVYITEHKKGDPDRSVSAAIRELQPDVFVNGGDRRSVADIPEALVCDELGIEMVFKVGGDKVQSSSWLTDKFPKHEERPWGDMDTLLTKDHWWVKRLTVKAGQSISLQKHRSRGEMWTCVDGEGLADVGDNTTVMKRGTSVWFGPGVIHRLTGVSDCTIVEVAYGDEMSEQDIKRYEDDYGRV